LNLPQKMVQMFRYLVAVAAAITPVVRGFNIVIPGGTGSVGTTLASILSNDGNDVTILCRNAYLAGAPNRVSSDFGWVGSKFLEKHPGVRLRDWDGGDLLDIVGQDWVGWQDDALAKADAVVNLVGGYTQQREMAAERLVSESLRVNPTALQITIAPKDDELRLISPGLPTAKRERLARCEQLVRENCANFECLRLEANRVREECERIQHVLYDRLK